MNNRTKGATLSLIVVLILVVIAVGACFYFMVKIFGGGRELQHATDSGNLNVAKKALRSPVVRVFGVGPYDISGTSLVTAQNNFSQLGDTSPTAGGQIDLLVYNRLVSHTMLVAINAAMDNYGNGPPAASGVANARNLIDCLSNKTSGIGQALARKFKEDSLMDTHFASLAGLAKMKMLNPGGTDASEVASLKEISYMARNMGSNVAIDPSVIPPAFSTVVAPGFITNNTVSKLGKTFVRGYSQINIPLPSGGSLTDPAVWPLMGVPMRPREMPHLVNYSDFTNLKPSPLPGDAADSTRIPPNAFASSGRSAEFKSGGFTRAMACSITGSIAVEGEFKTGLPCGVIIVANGPGTTPSGPPGTVTVDPSAFGLSGSSYGGGMNDVFSNQLMYPPNGVTMAANGAFSTNPANITAIQDFKTANPGLSVPAALVDGLDGPGTTTAEKQAFADGLDPGMSTVLCTNRNSLASQSPNQPTCVSNLPQMMNSYGMSSGSSGGGLSGLMALESYKAQVINPRPGGGPANVLINACTGMKGFNLVGLSDAERDRIDFGTPGTINNIIASFTGLPASPPYGALSTKAQQIRDSLVLRMRQMIPGASDAQINNILNQPLPMGAIKFIWADHGDPANPQFRYTDSAPSFFNAGQVLPDGTVMNVQTPDIDPNRAYVNMIEEQGYPSPWDCFSDPAGKTHSNLIWNPSSGFNCLMGVLRFKNCAEDFTASWDCPC